MNIMIFSVSIGNGHDQVANSVGNEMIRQSPTSKVTIINTLKFVNPLLNKVILKGYLNMLSISPKAWGKLYEKTDSTDSMIDINDITNILITKKVKSMLEEYQTDVIICTHPFPAAMMSNLKLKGQISCPLVSVVTDFTIHYAWINSETDYYVIPHSTFAAVMKEKYEVPMEKILPFGIPIRHEFLKTYDRTLLLPQLGLEDKKCILVMGGGLGLGAIDEIVREIDQTMNDIQIIAVAGRNAELEETLRAIETKNRFLVYGFTNQIPQLMEMSDLIITKPGGVTTAEILSKKKPLLIFDPLPGQEYENTEFLLNSGIALTTNGIDRIPMLISHLFEYPRRLEMIGEICTYYARPSAAVDLIHFIRNLKLETKLLNETLQ